MNELEHMEELNEQQPTIRLEVFRHDEKDTAEHDHIAPLTKKGRLNALESGRSKKPKVNQGYIVSSPRERALHSAVLQFFGPQFEELQLHDGSLDEALQKLKTHPTNERHNIQTDERLNFHVESHAAFNDRFYEEYNKKEGNRTLDFQLKDSDQMILDIAKRVSSIKGEEAESVMKIKGFKRMVGDLAEVMLEYIQKFPAWKKSYAHNPQDYDDAEMQVFIGTHSQNIECFLMKIIQLKQGTQALEAFLKGLTHGKSFIGYSEGFSCVVEEQNGNLMAKLQYKNESFSLTAEDLQRLVKERDEFNQQVQQKLQENPEE